MASVHDGAWNFPPRVAADIIDEYLNDLRSGTSHRIGPGETVPAVYVRLAMRALFADALHRLAPQTTRELTCEAAYEIVANTSMAIGELAMHPGYGQPLREAESREDQYVAAWQHQDNLPNPWLRTAAIMTMQRACELHRHGQTYTGPLCLPGVTVLAMLDDTPAHRLTDMPDCLEVQISTFNPYTETMDDAVKRLLPGLESQLHERLASIARDDLSLNDAVEPVTYRKTTAFDWLVRYQVLGASKRGIARAEHTDPSNVMRQVNQVADVIGLTLRAPTLGRPRKHRPSRPHSRTVKVLR